MLCILNAAAQVRKGAISLSSHRLLKVHSFAYESYETRYRFCLGSSAFGQSCTRTRYAKSKVQKYHGLGCESWRKRQQVRAMMALHWVKEKLERQMGLAPAHSYHYRTFVP